LRGLLRHGDGACSDQHAGTEPAEERKSDGHACSSFCSRYGLMPPTSICLRSVTRFADHELWLAQAAGSQWKLCAL
jgi:hypothetical protein